MYGIGLEEVEEDYKPKRGRPKLATNELMATKLRKSLVLAQKRLTGVLGAKPSLRKTMLWLAQHSSAIIDKKGK